MTRYVIMRKSDGLYRVKSRRYTEDHHWGEFDKAQLFKNPDGCRYALRSNLYEVHEQEHRGKWKPPTFHPEWFKKKFEIVPVKVQIRGDF